MGRGAITKPKSSGKRCFWCDVPTIIYPLNGTSPDNMHTIDHLYPKLYGGKAKVPCCARCNHDKGCMHPLVFRERHRPNVSIEKVMKTLRGEGASFHHIYEWHQSRQPQDKIEA
jgi:hypothetical protein